MIRLSVYYPHGMYLEFLGGDETLTSFVSLVHAGVSGIIMPKGVEIAPIPDSAWTGSPLKKAVECQLKILENIFKLLPIKGIFNIFNIFNPLESPRLTR